MSASLRSRLRNNEGVMSVAILLRYATTGSARLFRRRLDAPKIYEHVELPDGERTHRADPALWREVQLAGVVANFIHSTISHLHLRSHTFKARRCRIRRAERINFPAVFL